MKRVKQINKDCRVRQEKTKELKEKKHTKILQKKIQQHHK